MHARAHTRLPAPTGNGPGLCCKSCACVLLETDRNAKGGKELQLRIMGLTYTTDRVALIMGSLEGLHCADVTHKCMTQHNHIKT